MTLNMEFYAKLFDDEGYERPTKQLNHLTSILKERMPHFVMVQEGMFSVNDPLPFLEDAGLTLLVTSGPDGPAADASMPVSDMVYGYQGMSDLYQRSDGPELDGGKLWRGKTLYGQEKKEFFKNHIVNQIYSYADLEQVGWELTEENGAFLTTRTGAERTVLEECPATLTSGGSARDPHDKWTQKHFPHGFGSDVQTDGDFAFDLAKRSAVWVKIQHASTKRNMFLYSAHFSGGRFEDPHFNVMFEERRGQMMKIVDHFKSQENEDTNPLIMVVGDFNADKDYDILKAAGGGLVPITVDATKQAKSAKDLISKR